MSQQEKIAQEPLSVTRVLDKLIDASKVIQRRMGYQTSRGEPCQGSFYITCTGITSSQLEGYQAAGGLSRFFAKSSKSRGPFQGCFMRRWA